MHPDLERLGRVHQLDRQLRKLDDGARKQRAILVDAKAEIQRLAGQLDELNHQVAASKTTEHEAQRKAKRYHDRRASAQRVLDQGMGDPDAAQRQVEQCNEILDDLDTDLLEQMERQDTLEGQHTANAAARQAAQDFEDAAALSVPKILADLATKRAKVQSERDGTYAPLDNDMKYKYEQLVEKKRTAVALLEKGVCSSCQIVVQNQQISDLKRGLIKPCRGCHRWLVLPQS